MITGSRDRASSRDSNLADSPARRDGQADQQGGPPSGIENNAVVSSIFGSN